MYKVQEEFGKSVSLFTLNFALKVSHCIKVYLSGVLYRAGKRDQSLPYSVIVYSSAKSLINQCEKVLHLHLLLPGYVEWNGDHMVLRFRLPALWFLFYTVIVKEFVALC